MMQRHVTRSVEERLQRLEQKLLAFQLAFALAIACLSGVAYLSFAKPRVSADSPKILRLRGLVIEDAQGRERILIGTPVPQVAGRKRHDAADGLIIMGDNGADRVVLGAPAPDPQSSGRVTQRIGPAAGIEVNDKDGNERGGLGVLDNDGRVVLGLDYPSKTGGEALTLAVLPEGPSLQIKDTSSFVRAGLTVQKDSAAKFYGVSWHDKTSLDLSILRLAPYALTQQVIQPDEKQFQNAFDAMRP